MFRQPSSEQERKTLCTQKPLRAHHCQWRHTTALAWRVTFPF